MSLSGQVHSNLPQARDKTRRTSDDESLRPIVDSEWGGGTVVVVDTLIRKE